MERSRKIRAYVAAATGAIPVAAFSSYLWLFFADFASRPNLPDPANGLLHRLNNHGSYAYISDADATALSALMLCFFLGLISTAIIAPKQHRIKAPATPLLRSTVITSTDLDIPSWEFRAVFLGSLAVCWAIIALGGASIVKTIVAHGIVLTLFVT